MPGLREPGAVPASRAERAAPEPLRGRLGRAAPGLALLAAAAGLVLASGSFA